MAERCSAQNIPVARRAIVVFMDFMDMFLSGDIVLLLEKGFTSLLASHCRIHANRVCKGEIRNNGRNVEEDGHVHGLGWALMCNHVVTGCNGLITPGMLMRKGLVYVCMKWDEVVVIFGSGGFGPQSWSGFSLQPTSQNKFWRSGDADALPLSISV